MWKVNHGALTARRWGRILCVGVASCTLVACATTSESRNPPSQCSRGSARPANPNGSVLIPTVGAAGQQSGNVMVFGQGDQPATGTEPNAPVPAVPATGAATETGQDLSNAKRAPSRSRRSISMGPRALLQNQVGSC